MSKIQWVIADPHFSHTGITQFVRSDGCTPVRPWDNPEDMDAALEVNWNAVVGEHDRVYVLGDVAINKRGLLVLERLHGRKVLICGNHDIFGAKEYLKYFQDVRGYKVVDGVGGPAAILSHIPIHPDSMARFRVNIHGHLHSNHVVRDGVPDPRYVCVSMERTDFTPVRLDHVIGAAHKALYGVQADGRCSDTCAVDCFCNARVLRQKALAAQSDFGADVSGLSDAEFIQRLSQ